MKIKYIKKLEPLRKKLNHGLKTEKGTINLINPKLLFEYIKSKYVSFITFSNLENFLKEQKIFFNKLSLNLIYYFFKEEKGFSSLSISKIIFPSKFFDYKKRRNSLVNESDTLTESEKDFFCKILELELSLADYLVSTSIDNPFIIKEDFLQKIFPLPDFRDNITNFLKFHKKDRFDEKEVNIIIERSCRKLEKFDGFDDFFRFQKLKNSFINRDQKNNLLKRYKDDPVMLTMLLNKTDKEMENEKISGDDSIDIKSLKRNTVKNVSLLEVDKTNSLNDSYSKENDIPDTNSENLNFSQHPTIKNSISQDLNDKKNKDLDYKKNNMINFEKVHIELPFENKVALKASHNGDQNDKIHKYLNVHKEEDDMDEINGEQDNLSKSKEIINDQNLKEDENNNLKRKLKVTFSAQALEKDNIKKNSSVPKIHKEDDINENEIEKKNTNSKTNLESSRSLNKKNKSKIEIDKSLSKNKLDKSQSKNKTDKSLSKNKIDKSLSKNKIDKSLSKKINDKRPSNNNIDKKPSNKKIDKSPSNKNIDKSPSKKIIDKSPSNNKIDKSPSNNKIQQRPSNIKIDKSPSNKKIDKSQSKKIIDKSPSNNKIQQRPSNIKIDKSPSKNKIDTKKKDLSKNKNKDLNVVDSKIKKNQKDEKINKINTETKNLPLKPSKKIITPKSPNTNSESQNNLVSLNDSKISQKNQKKLEKSPSQKKSPSTKNLKNSMRSKEKNSGIKSPIQNDQILSKIDPRLLVKNLKGTSLVVNNNKSKSPDIKKRQTMILNTSNSKKKNSLMINPRIDKKKHFSTTKKYKANANTNLDNEKTSKYIIKDGVQTKVTKTKQLIRKELQVSNKLPLVADSNSKNKFQRYLTKNAINNESYQKMKDVIENPPQEIMKKKNVIDSEIFNKNQKVFQTLTSEVSEKSKISLHSQSELDKSNPSNPGEALIDDNANENILKLDSINNFNFVKKNHLKSSPFDAEFYKREKFESDVNEGETKSEKFSNYSNTKIKKNYEIEKNHELKIEKKENESHLSNEQKLYGTIEGIQLIQTIEKKVSIEQKTKKEDSNILKNIVVVMDDEDNKRKLEEKSSTIRKSTINSKEFSLEDEESSYISEDVKPKKSIERNEKNFVSFRVGQNGKNNKFENAKNYRFEDEDKDGENENNQDVKYNPFKINEEISEIKDESFNELEKKNKSKSNVFNENRKKKFNVDFSVEGSFLDDIKLNNNEDLETQSVLFNDHDKEIFDRSAFSVDLVDKQKKNQTKFKYNKQEVYNFLQGSDKNSLDKKNKKKFNQSDVDILNFIGHYNNAQKMKSEDFQKNNENILINKNSTTNTKQKLENDEKQSHNESQQLRFYPNSPSPNKMHPHFFQNITEKLKKNSEIDQNKYNLFNSNENPKEGTYTVDTRYIVYDHYHNQVITNSSQLPNSGNNSYMDHLKQISDTNLKINPVDSNYLVYDRLTNQYVKPNQQQLQGILQNSNFVYHQNSQVDKNSENSQKERFLLENSNSEYLDNKEELLNESGNQKYKHDLLSENNNSLHKNSTNIFTKNNTSIHSQGGNPQNSHFYKDNLRVPNHLLPNQNFLPSQQQNSFSEKNNLFDLQAELLRQQILINSNLMNEHNSFLKELLMKEKDSSEKKYEEMKKEIQYLSQKLEEKKNEKIEIQVNIPERENKITLDNKYNINVQNELNDKKDQKNKISSIKEEILNKEDVYKNLKKDESQLIEKNNLVESKLYSKRENSISKNEMDEIENYAKKSLSRNKDPLKLKKKSRIFNKISIVKNLIDGSKSDFKVESEDVSSYKSENDEIHILEKDRSKSLIINNSRNKSLVDEDLSQSMISKKSNSINNGLKKLRRKINKERSISLKNDKINVNNNMNILDDLEKDKKYDKNNENDANNDVNNTKMTNYYKNLKRKELEKKNSAIEDLIQNNDIHKYNENNNNNQINNKHEDNKNKPGYEVIEKTIVITNDNVKTIINPNENFNNEINKQNHNQIKNRNVNQSQNIFNNKNDDDKNKPGYEVIEKTIIITNDNVKTIINPNENFNNELNKQNHNQIKNRNVNDVNNIFNNKHKEDKNKPGYEVIEKTIVITNDNVKTIINPNENFNHDTKKDYSNGIKNRNVYDVNNIFNNKHQDEKNKPAYEVIERTVYITNDNVQTIINPNENLNNQINEKYSNEIKNKNVNEGNNLFNNKHEDDKNKLAYEVIEKTVYITNDNVQTIIPSEMSHQQRFVDETPEEIKNRLSYFDSKFVNPNFNQDNLKKKEIKENLTDNKTLSIEQKIQIEKNLKMVLTRFLKKIIVYNSKIEQLKSKQITKNLIKEIFDLYKTEDKWLFKNFNVFIKNLGLNILPTQKKRLFLSMSYLDSDQNRVIDYKNLIHFFVSHLNLSNKNEYGTFSNEKNIFENFFSLKKEEKVDLIMKGTDFHFLRKIIIFQLKKLEDITLVVQYLNNFKNSKKYLLIAKTENHINKNNIISFLENNRCKFLKEDIVYVFREFQSKSDLEITYEEFEDYFSKNIWKIPI